MNKTLSELREEIEKREQEIYDEGWAAFYSGKYNNTYIKSEEREQYDKGYNGAIYVLIEDYILPKVHSVIKETLKKEKVNNQCTFGGNLDLIANALFKVLDSGTYSDGN